MDMYFTLIDKYQLNNAFELLDLIIIYRVEEILISLLLAVESEPMIVNRTAEFLLFLH